MTRKLIWLTAVLLSPVSRSEDSPFAVELGFMEPQDLAGLSVRGAWSPSPYLSAELGFQDLAVNGDKAYMANHRDQDASALTADLRLDLPFTKKIGMFGRLGYAVWSADYRYNDGVQD